MQHHMLVFVRWRVVGTGWDACQLGLGASRHLHFELMLGAREHVNGRTRERIAGPRYTRPLVDNSRRRRRRCDLVAPYQ